MSRRVIGLALGCALVAGCSSTPAPTSRAGATPGATPAAAVAVRTPLQLAQLRDRASHVWTLGRSGSTAVDLVPADYPTRLVGKAPLLTSGPGGSTAARFQGSGRYVTPVAAAEVGPGRAFTVEFAFRSDDCTHHWSHVLGTGMLTSAGRQGLNVLHYPASFMTPCRMAFEFWKDGAYKGGCSTPNPLADGRWELYAMTYDGRTATCFNDGRKVGTSKPGAWTSPVGQDFGIGGAPAGYGGSLDSGSLADVALYRSALTPAQVAQHARLLSVT
jgi:hypothetical protein